MAAVTFSMLEDLVIEPKLLAITCDNAPNNDTLVEHLHQKLLKQFDDEVDPDFSNTQPIMRFCSKQSCIRCIAHVLNHIVQKILAKLKTGTAKEAKDSIDTPAIASANAVVKVQLLILWICKCP